MRASKDFIMREIAGEHILVPTGAAAVKFNGLITLNEVGKYIFDLLAEERTVQELVRSLTGEYDVSQEEAARDVEEFVQQLRDLGALVEGE